MKENETKYTPDMCEKAYSILASGGTHDKVCIGLNISRETFYQWLGRGKYKNSKYFKKDLSDNIKKGEMAGRVLVDDEIKKAATEKCTGNPTMLIYLSKRRDFSGQLLPDLKEMTYKQRLDDAAELYSDGIICTDTYEQILRCIERDAGVMDKTQLEEVKRDIKELREAVAELKLKKQEGEGGQC